MLKEVYFDVWCKRCKYADYKEEDEPCWECLTNPANENSHRPVKFKAKEDADDRNTSR